MTSSTLPTAVPSYPQALTGPAKLEAIEAAVTWCSGQLTEVAASLTRGESPYGPGLSRVDLERWSVWYSDSAAFDPALSMARTREVRRALDRVFGAPDKDPGRVFTTPWLAPTLRDRLTARLAPLVNRLIGRTPPTLSLPTWRPRGLVVDLSTPADRRESLLERLNAYAETQARPEYLASGEVEEPGNIVVVGHWPIAGRLDHEIRVGATDGTLTADEAARAAVVLAEIRLYAQTARVEFPAIAAELVTDPTRFTTFNDLYGPRSRPPLHSPNSWLPSRGEIPAPSTGSAGAAALISARAAASSTYHAGLAATAPVTQPMRLRADGSMSALPEAGSASTDGVEHGI